VLGSPKFPPPEEGRKTHQKSARPQDKKKEKDTRPYQERQLQRPSTRIVYSSSYGRSLGLSWRLALGRKAPRRGAAKILELRLVAKSAGTLARLVYRCMSGANLANNELDFASLFFSVLSADGGAAIQRYRVERVSSVLRGLVLPNNENIGGATVLESRSSLLAG